MQCTEKDEFAYHEMIAHVPLFAHPSPKTVLIVGGGDGGTLREVAKHPEVEEIHLCEIDEKVIEVSKKYLPSVSVGFSSPKLTVHIEDGIKFMEKYSEKFDVIITDSSDPIDDSDLAAPLYEKPYYELTNIALKPGGILCCLGDCLFTDLPFMKECTETLRSVFPVVGYSSTTVSTYACGQVGFLLAGKDKNTMLQKPVRGATEAQVKEFGLRYYNYDVHCSSFVLPQFAQELNMNS